jgi:hypothetical protein
MDASRIDSRIAIEEVPFDGYAVLTASEIEEMNRSWDELEWENNDRDDRGMPQHHEPCDWDSVYTDCPF